MSRIKITLRPSTIRVHWSCARSAQDFALAESCVETVYDIAWTRKADRVLDACDLRAQDRTAIFNEKINRVVDTDDGKGGPVAERVQENGWML